jgi:hypothetical protein
MREILFRGIWVHGNKEWIEGDLVRDSEGKPHIVDTKYAVYWGGESIFVCEDECEVIPETVGQYTGLTDKNGKKIFEGDYWLDTDGDYLVYVVEFREGQFGFVCYGWKGMLMPYGFDETAGGFGKIDFSPMTDFSIDLIEIDGNIHDNPEILEVK